MSKHKQQIIGLFKKANIEDAILHHPQPTGWGQAINYEISSFDNIGLMRHDVVGHTISSFEDAQAVLRTRIVQPSRPIYWIETVVFLPQKILMYLGTGEDSALIKFAQIIWWIFTFITMVVGIVFNKYFHSWIDPYLPAFLNDLWDNFRNG